MKLSSLRERSSLWLSVLVILLTAVFYPGGDLSAALVQIPGLFNTGVDDNREKKLKDGEIEEHYILTGAAEGAFVISDGSKPYLWTPSLGQSAWIGPAGGNVDAPAGYYFYTLSFDMSGLVPSTAQISGRWALDNAAEIFLNGLSTGIIRADPGFRTLTDFNIGSDLFVAGLNALEFRVQNLTSPEANPSGLLVLGLSGTAAEVPIPSTVWLLGAALTALYGFRRALTA